MPTAEIDASPSQPISGLSSDSPAWQASAMRILVAEDDARLRQHLVAALRDGGHEVDETGDGLEALAFVRKSSV